MQTQSYALQETRFVPRKSRGSMFISLAKVITIFDRDSESTFIIAPYDKYCKAEILYINIYDSLGHLMRKVKKSEFIDEIMPDGVSIFTDRRYVGFLATGSLLPYTIEYSYRITNFETLSYPSWYPQTPYESVEKAVFILDAPQRPRCKHKSIKSKFRICE
jgi:hypothetical protein